MNQNHERYLVAQSEIQTDYHNTTDQAEKRGLLFDAVEDLINLRKSIDWQIANDVASDNKAAMDLINANYLSKYNTGLLYSECSMIMTYFPERSQWVSAESILHLKCEAKNRLMEEHGKKPKQKRNTATVAMVEERDKKIKELESQLEEKDKEIKSLRGKNRRLQKKLDDHLRQISIS